MPRPTPTVSTMSKNFPRLGGPWPRAAEMSLQRNDWQSYLRLRASDDPQHSAQCAALDALIAAAEGDPAGTLAHAHEVLAIVSAIGLRSESFVEGWPLAVRAARTLGEADEVEEMIAMLDIHPVGHLPGWSAERDLARARRAGDTGEQGADELFRTRSRRNVASAVPTTWPRRCWTRPSSWPARGTEPGRGSGSRRPEPLPRPWVHSPSSHEPTGSSRPSPPSPPSPSRAKSMDTATGSAATIRNLSG